MSFSSFLLAFQKKLNNSEDIEKDEIKISDEIDEFSKIQEFFKIPFSKILEILSFSKIISVETAIHIINGCYKEYGDQTIKILNSLSIFRADFEDLIKIIGNFQSSPLCQQIKSMYFNQTDVEVDWNYEIEMKNKEIEKLQQKLEKYEPKIKHETTPQQTTLKSKMRNNRRAHTSTDIFDACKHSDSEYIMNYIKEGKSLNICNRDKETPLLILAQMGDIDLVKMAVNSGAHLEAKSAFGYTAFARACEYGYLSIAQFLLSKGADINTTNSDGFTPLFYAARDGNIKILQLLLLSGANKYIRNVSGKQAIDYAKEKNIKQILQDYS